MNPAHLFPITGPNTLSHLQQTTKKSRISSATEDPMKIHGVDDDKRVGSNAETPSMIPTISND
uniref:Uncharacterized protein n=1 Tax=Solanum lycopersicum TaxID=4081 RepID=A0A3Q7IEX4_SOLLC